MEIVIAIDRGTRRGVLAKVSDTKRLDFTTLSFSYSVRRTHWKNTYKVYIMTIFCTDLVDQIT